MTEASKCAQVFRDFIYEAGQKSKFCPFSHDQVWSLISPVSHTFLNKNARNKGNVNC